jgi:F-box and WD-40 domain protein CDC4
MDPQSPVDLSLTQRRASLIDSDNENTMTSRNLPQPIATGSARLSRRNESISQPHPRPLPTPNKATFPHNLLPSAPASPPTPAPSPTPHQRAPSWKSAGENEDQFLRDARTHFSGLGGEERQRFLAEILNLCDSQQLSFVHSFVSPRLKKDPFKSFPNELCLRVWISK